MRWLVACAWGGGAVKGERVQKRHTQGNFLRGPDEATGSASCQHLANELPMAGGPFLICQPLPPTLKGGMAASRVASTYVLLVVRPRNSMVMTVPSGIATVGLSTFGWSRTRVLMFPFDIPQPPPRAGLLQPSSPW